MSTTKLDVDDQLQYLFNIDAMIYITIYTLYWSDIFISDAANK